MQKTYDEVFLLNFVRINRDLSEATIDGVSDLSFFLAKDSRTGSAIGITYFEGGAPYAIVDNDFYSVLASMVDHTILKKFNKAFSKRRRAEFLMEMVAAAIFRDASDFELENNICVFFVDGDDSSINGMVGSLGVRVISIDFESFAIDKLGNFQKIGQDEIWTTQEAILKFQDEGIEWSMVFEMK
jgi:hypothetical protein